MDAGLASIIVALLTTVGGVIVAMIHKFRKENKEDHHVVRETLTMIRNDIKEDLSSIQNDVKDVHEKLDNHIDWHLRIK